MDPRSPGTRRYFYEYLFQQAVEAVKARTGKPFLVSAARKARAAVDTALAREGRSISDADLKVGEIALAIDEGLATVVADHVPVFSEPSPAAEFYQAAYRRFSTMTGIEGRPGDMAGPRLPLSPYDPRWASRASVKAAGSKPLYVLDGDIMIYGGGAVTRLHEVDDEGFMLYEVDEDGNAYDAGRAVTIDDVSGLTELMGRMSQKEYASVRPWALAAARTSTGYDTSQFMSEEALARSVAVLDHLRDEGIPYTVGRDRSPGQIVARIKGTKISIRLTDTRRNEAYVGRVYDDGMAIHFSTNHRVQGSNKSYTYTPTADEAVSLLRVAMGQPVERADGKGMVGQRATSIDQVWNQAERRRVPTEVEESYYAYDDSAHMAVYGPLLIDGEQPSPGAKVFVRRIAKHRSARTKYFGSPEAAMSFLEEAVSSARQSFVSLIDADRLIEEAREVELGMHEEGYVPEMSGDNEASAIQRAYWDVLTGRRDTLLRPGASEEEYDEATVVLASLDMGPEQRDATHDMLAGRFAYTGTREERVRAHLADVADGMVGTLDLHEEVSEDGELRMVRFNPSRVAQYMRSEKGAWGNTADLVAAMRRAGIAADELMGSGYGTRAIQDRLVEFDASATWTEEELPEGTSRRMLGVVRDSLGLAGAYVKDLRVDSNGIIRYEAERVDRLGNPRLGKNDRPDTVVGYVGQVFEQGDLGEIETQFANGDNYLLVPGYEARIRAQRPGEDLSVEERTVLRGYEQVMEERIRHQVVGDMMSMRSEVGDPVSVNGVYRSLYEERLPLDYLETADERGLDRGWGEAIVSTMARRVRYPDSMGDTFYESWAQERGMGWRDDPSNDNFDSPLRLAGRNMAIIPEASEGYFDPDMANASNMGTTFFLVEGAQVDPSTGAITKSPEAGDRSPIMKHPDTRFMGFDAWNRRNMIASTLLRATSVTEPEGVILSDVLKGWTADDGRVVSKDYAERNRMVLKDGSTRPLVVGDKDTDLHGNKGVIGLVVDPDMDPEDAAAQGLEDAVALFRQNPGLSVVMSPFSGVSRFNGGTAREMAEGVQDAVMPDGTVVPGGMGTMRFVITNKNVDAGTRVYDDEAIAMGKGRRASAQLAWGLGAQGADRVMAEFYGPNSSAAVNFREYLVTMGLDMDGDGTLRKGYQEATAEQRRLMEMPEMRLTSNGMYNARAMRADFAALLEDRGGDMEIPFPLKFPTEAIVPGTGRGTWRLPVLSSHLRAGQEMEDGSSAAHDFTNQYLAIFEETCKYRHAQAELEREDLPAARRATLQARLTEAPARAQLAFNAITGAIADRHFSGRRNIFKEGLMSSRLPNSATAVWTADPRLDIDQVGVGEELAEGLGLVDDDYVMVWRDPVLRDGGIRYLRVKTDPRLVGVSINPVMDKSFDGDFDGDSVALAVLTSEGAKKQARELLTVEANLLDLGHREEVVVGDDEMDLYPLAMQNSLDTKVSQHFNPALRDRFAELQLEANEAYEDFREGSIGREAFLARARRTMSGLNDYYHEALGQGQRSVTLRFDSPESHLKSLHEACIETGAKGSQGKFESYARYYGADPETGEDLGGTGRTREDDEGVMVAMTVKTMVGIAGAYAQRGVRSLRDHELKAVTELTYVMTQGMLQISHDPEAAKDVYGLLMDGGRSLWRGREMERVPVDGRLVWTAKKDDNGGYIQADPKTWQEQFIQICSGPGGLGVSVDPENVAAVAEALTHEGRIVDIEDAQMCDEWGKGSTMDRLAYGGTFADVLAAASREENMFKGSQTAQLAPYSIRRNQRALEDYAVAMERRADDTREVEAAQVEPLLARDVLAEGNEMAKTRGSSRRSARARAVAARRPAPVVEETEQTEAGDLGDNDYFGA